MAKKALVVDDSGITRGVISLILKAFNFSCKEARNGVEALNVLNSDSTYDLVMLDWSMPEMNGSAFLTEVKTRENLQHLKVIVVTANDTPEASAEAQSIGADDVILKPFSRTVVLEKLRMHGLN